MAENNERGSRNSIIYRTLTNNRFSYLQLRNNLTTERINGSLQLVNGKLIYYDNNTSHELTLTPIETAEDLINAELQGMSGTVYQRTGGQGRHAGGEAGGTERVAER